MRERHAVTINVTVTSVLRGARMVRLLNGDTSEITETSRTAKQLRQSVIAHEMGSISI